VATRSRMRLLAYITANVMCFLAIAVILIAISKAPSQDISVATVLSLGALIGLVRGLYIGLRDRKLMGLTMASLSDAFGPTSRSWVGPATRDDARAIAHTALNRVGAEDVTDVGEEYVVGWTRHRLMPQKIVPLPKSQQYQLIVRLSPDGELTRWSSAARPRFQTLSLGGKQAGSLSEAIIARIRESQGIST
jgi:hypothetical protein